jgi:uncharacterized protein YndB with AHSA1/START domain
MTEQISTLVAEVTVAASFETVWRALRDPAEIRRWHGWEYEGLDEEIDQIYLSGADASEPDGTVDLRGADTRIVVEERDGATAVRVTRGGDAAPGFDEIDEGWITFLNQLRFALERHPGEDRRTTHVKGEVVWQNENQVGVRVGEWNDALLVVHRTGRVIVSTYPGG